MRIATPVGLAIFAFFALWALVLQFQHPELTDTQRLIEFWPQILGGLVGGLIAIVGWSRQ